jgi:hypothetical protein
LFKLQSNDYCTKHPPFSHTHVFGLQNKESFEKKRTEKSASSGLPIPWVFEAVVITEKPKKKVNLADVRSQNLNTKAFPSLLLHSLQTQLTRIGTKYQSSKGRQGSIKKKRINTSN